MLSTVRFPRILVLAMVVRLAAVAASYVAPRALALRDYRSAPQPCSTLADHLARRPVCTPLAEDETAYDALGRSVAAGQGFVLGFPWVYGTSHAPTAYGNFLYPAFLGAVYAATGGSALALVLLQSLLGTMVVLALAVSATSVAGVRAGTLVGVLAALHPGLVLASSLVLTEALVIPLVVGLFVAWMRFLRKPSGGSAVLVGALAAGACLTRSPALYAVPAMMVVTLVGHAGAVRRRGLVLTIVGVAALLMIPWTVRNFVRFGAFVPADTKAGAALWLFNHPSPAPLREVWSGLPNAVPPLAPVPGLNEAQAERHFRGLAVRYIVGAPVAFAEASLLRLGLFLVPFPRNWHLPWLKAAASLVYLGVTWLGIVGLWRARRTLEVRALLGLGLTWIVLLAATSTGLRFRLAVEWILVFGAGLALARLWPARTTVTASVGAGPSPGDADGT